MFPGGEGDRCVGLTTLPPSCADCLEIWEPQPPGNIRACIGSALPLPHKYNVESKFYTKLLNSKSRLSQTETIPHLQLVTFCKGNFL